MRTNTIDVINRGLRCLSENIGAEETELFISTLLREKFDYTVWRRSFLDQINTFEDMDAFLKKTQEKALFNGNAKIVL